MMCIASLWFNDAKLIACIRGFECAVSIIIVMPMDVTAVGETSRDEEESGEAGSQDEANLNKDNGILERVGEETEKPADEKDTMTDEEKDPQDKPTPTAEEAEPATTVDDNQKQGSDDVSSAAEIEAPEDSHLMAFAKRALQPQTSHEDAAAQKIPSQMCAIIF